MPVHRSEDKTIRGEDQPQACIRGTGPVLWPDCGCTRTSLQLCRHNSRTLRVQTVSPPHRNSTVSCGRHTRIFVTIFLNALQLLYITARYWPTG